MGIRRFFLLAGALAAGVVGLGTGQPASAQPITDLVAQPFEVAGTLFNAQPPDKVGDIRIYIDNNNFTLRPVTAYSPARLQARIEYDNGFGPHTIPFVTQYSLNGTATDADTAMIEGCDVVTTGYLFNVPAQVNRDLAVALQVDVTCP